MHIIFLHGTGGTPDEAFFPWCRNELEQAGHRTSAPAFPSAAEPDLEGWIAAVRDLYQVDEETVLVGRSLGGTLIPFLLEQEGIQVKAAISLAAPINHLGWDNLKAFFSHEPDFEKAQQNCEHWFHWYSDDDPHVPLKHGEQLRELLGGEFRVFEGYSHFYNEQFPELVETIQNLI